MKRWVKLLVSLAVRGCDVVHGEALRRIGRQPLPACVVLYYHAVPARHRERFARQMDLLLRVAEPVSTESPAAVQSGKRCVAVTFDDGFVSVLRNAAPELKRRQIPWTMFVPTGCLGQTAAWLRNPHPSSQQERVVTRDELLALANDSSVTIGSHTAAHAHLVEIGLERARVELAESKATLESILNRPVDQFSYPFGARTQALDKQAHALGYRRLYSTNPSMWSDPAEFVIGRVAVAPDISLLEFRLKLLGAYRWLAQTNRNGRKLKAES